VSRRPLTTDERIRAGELIPAPQELTEALIASGILRRETDVIFPPFCDACGMWLPSFRAVPPEHCHRCDECIVHDSRPWQYEGTVEP
jgi:hypothetical protein